MAFVDPSRYANQREALRPHPTGDGGDTPPRRRRIRNLAKVLFGRKSPKD
jgi:hypothetical protein